MPRAAINPGAAVVNTDSAVNAADLTLGPPYARPADSGRGPVHGGDQLTAPTAGWGGTRSAPEQDFAGVGHAGGDGRGAGGGLLPRDQQPGGQTDSLSRPGAPTPFVTPMADLPRMGFGLALPRIAETVPRGLSLYDTEMTARRGPGPWDLARELLGLGILKESDWTGDLSASFTKGLRRWVDEDLGAKRMKILAPLSLIAGNDARRYFLKMDDRSWRHEIKAVEHWPIGFFALSWGEPTQPIYVADRVMELDAAFPGLGYGLCDLLGCAFQWTCNGVGFRWGYEMALSAERKLKEDWLDAEIESGFDKDELDDRGFPPAEDMERLEDYWAQMLHDGEAFGDGTYLTTGRFRRLIPEKAFTSQIRGTMLPDAFREIEGLSVKGFENGRAVGARRVSNSKLTGAQRAKRKYLQVVKSVFDLAQLLNHSSRTHVGCDHMPLIANAGKPMIRNCPVYLAWHPEDEMGRIVDDMFNRSIITRPNISDLVWMHGFQMPHTGEETRQADRFKEMARQVNPDALSSFPLAPDGSLTAAVASTERCVRMCVLIDEILQWLHTPQPEDSPTELGMRIEAFVQSGNRVRIRV